MKCPKCQTENPPESIYCGKCSTRIRGHVSDPEKSGRCLPDSPQPVVTETMGATREELTTGSTFAGRYQVIEELGRGGMGKVYKVHDTKIGEKIALKLIRPEMPAWTRRRSSGSRTSSSSPGRSVTRTSARCSTWVKTRASAISPWSMSTARTSGSSSARSGG